MFFSFRMTSISWKNMGLFGPQEKSWDIIIYEGTDWWVGGAGGWGWWFRFVIRDSFRFLQVLQFFNRQKLLNVMLKVFKTGKFRQINCGKAQVCFAARPSQPPSAATHPLNVSIILPPMSRDSKDVMGSWHFSVISIQMILLIGWSPCPHWPGNWPIKIQIPESCWRKFSSLFFNRF